MADTSEVVLRHANRGDLERRSRPESSHKGNLKRLKTSSVGGFQRWEKENELLWAMLEDETEWLAKLFPDIIITPELFFYALEDGVVLCRLANLIQETADDYGRKNKVKVPAKSFKFHASIPKKNKQLALFKSRENVQGFLTWCRQIGISDSILFESNDVVEADECREGCREVVICLMEIARRAFGAFKFSPIPKLIQLEKEIEIEEQKEAEENLTDHVDYGSSDEESNNSCPSPETHSPPTHDEHPSPSGDKKKSKRHHPKSELDQEVYKIIGNFNVYNIRKIKEGKYMILGKIIFVRMLNGHVLLRIGGGWDTLEHYLLTHLPKAASENGHSSTEVTVSPSVSKTPQKSQLTKILDKVKKEHHLKATPSPYRTAGRTGGKEHEENDEKDITSAIRKIEFSVNQNIATRRKVSRHSQEETPQKSPNPVENSSSNTPPSDINQNNLTEGQKVLKSKSSKGKTMENEEIVFNEHNGGVFNSEQQNGELGCFESALGKNTTADECLPSSEQCGTTEDTADVVDGAVFAKFNPESAVTEQVESKPVDHDLDISQTEDSASENKQSSGTEVSLEVLGDQFAEQMQPAEVETGNVDDIQNSSDLQMNGNDVVTNSSDFLSGDPDVKPSVPEDAPIDFEVPYVPPSDGEVLASDPDVPAVIPDDSKNSENTAQESAGLASKTPDVPVSPQKSPSPTEKKGSAETPKKTTGKTTKDPTKTKPTGTKTAGKKEPGSTVGSRPKSAKPTRPNTAEISAQKNTKRPTSAVNSNAGTAGKSSASKLSTAKTSTTPTKSSTSTSRAKVPPSGKPLPTKTATGKTSPTNSKKPTPKPDPKAAPPTKSEPKVAPSTRTTRPAKTSAFGSTVSTAPTKKPAQKTRPVTAPPASSSTTQAKKRPVAPKVQSWATGARPQSAKPSTKAKDATDGGVPSKETGGERPTSPTKPLVRKTQTRTVTTTKTTRVGAGGEPETKSQTLKATRTVTEVNGKKTTKTTVKEISPTGRKPLRMTTETTEGGTGAKKPTKPAATSKTTTKTAKVGTKKPETKTGAKTAPSKTKETGAKKAPTKAAPKSKGVKTEVKGLPKAKTVKELSNALGITKPTEEKEVKEKEPEESMNKNVEAPSPDKMPELPPAQTEVSPEAGGSVQVNAEESVAKSEPDQLSQEPEVTPEPKVSPEPVISPELAVSPQPVISPEPVESPKPVDSPEPAISPEPVVSPKPADSPEPVISPEPVESPEPADSPKSAISPEPVVSPEPTDSPQPVISPGPAEAPEPADSSETAISPEPGIECTQDGSVGETEVVREEKEIIESVNIDSTDDKIEQLPHETEPSVDIANTEEKPAVEAAEQVQANDDEVGEDIAANEKESGDVITEDSETIVMTTQRIITEALEEVSVQSSAKDEEQSEPNVENSPEPQGTSDVLVQSSPEPRDPSEIVDDSVEDDSLDVIVVPESDTSHYGDAFQSTEAWPAVSVNEKRTHDTDILGDNNNAVAETEPKLDPYLFPTGTDPEELTDITAEQNLLDIDDEKPAPWLGENPGNTGEKLDRDSGFQENTTVDDLLG